MTISDDDIWSLEERFWLDGEPAYRAHRIASAVMLFPEPAGIMQGEDILAFRTQGSDRASRRVAALCQAPRRIGLAADDSPNGTRANLDPGLPEPSSIYGAAASRR